VGIVGRTGAGKSTLVAALFRIIESKSGYIHIDGFNIKKLRLATLRRSLSIIPQSPVLMAGTLRHNLDPFDDVGDSEIMEALEAAQLLRKIQEIGHGLQCQVVLCVNC